MIDHDEPIKVLHAADLHIGSGMAVGRRVGREEDLTAATWDALENVIEIALAESVDLVTIGGDVFDKADQHNPLPRMKLISALRNLGDIPVALVRGNHDHLSRSVAPILWPDNVKELTKSNPTLDLGRLCVHGVSYDRERVTIDLVPSYPDPSPEKLNIGILHANVGSQSNHAVYAPTDVDTLSNKGYEAWLLGHIHQRRVLCESPLILYPGNIQGRHAGEMGPRSVDLLTIDQSGAITCDTRIVHSVLWDTLELDLTEVSDIDGLLSLIDQIVEERKESLNSERGLVLRLLLTGQTDLHESLSATRWSSEHETITDLVQDHVHSSYAEQDPFILIDKVLVRTMLSFDFDELRAQEDNVLGVIARMLDDEEARSAALGALADVGIPNDEFDEGEVWKNAVHGALGRIRGRTG